MTQIYEVGRRAILMAAWALATTGTSHAQSWRLATDEPPSVERYVVYRSAGPIRIDGTLDAIEWVGAPWSSRFVDIEGRTAPAPALDTRVKLLWDERYLYVAARLEEPHVWATLRTRDTIIYHDDDFEVFLDPDGDSHRYYELEINAFGTVWDLFLEKPYRDGGPAVTAWDVAGLEYAVAVAGSINDPLDTDRGWTVELALPFHALDEDGRARTVPRDGEQWRANFSRVDWPVTAVDGGYRKVRRPTEDDRHPEANWVWSPQGAVNMHLPEMWGVLQFSDAVAGTRSVDPRPLDDAALQWLLRRVYYAEREYYRVHGRYTSDLAALGVAGARADGGRWNLSVRLTEDGYLAGAVGQDGGWVWQIRQDGRLWRTVLED
ncbi:MAG: carbohydrate-binding family 9-like protein [Gemmatimonadales bacterium]